jgi:hypothetical protein
MAWKRISIFETQGSKWHPASYGPSNPPHSWNLFTPWQIVFNPVFEAIYTVPVPHTAATSNLPCSSRVQPEVHQIFLGGDWQAGPVFSANLGTGFDLSSQGPGVVLKSRFEWDWRKH